MRHEACGVRHEACGVRHLLLGDGLLDRGGTAEDEVLLAQHLHGVHLASVHLGRHQHLPWRGVGQGAAAAAAATGRGKPLPLPSLAPGQQVTGLSASAVAKAALAKAAPPWLWAEASGMRQAGDLAKPGLSPNPDLDLDPSPSPSHHREAGAARDYPTLTLDPDPVPML